jgi:hypothetical protein
MFSDEFAWGFPAAAPHLDAHLRLLAGLAPDAPWMVAGLGVDIRPLIEPAVSRGVMFALALRMRHGGLG